jgi:WD40 repeat protein
MSRIFLSHSSVDTREAVALKHWLAEQDPPLANEIFLDVDPESGLQTGTRWKDALRRANARCEAVICLLSPNWEASQECRVEYRTAENLNKQIFMARLGPSTGDDLTSEWQRCDLFGDGPRTAVDIGGGPPVEFATQGLYRLRDGIRGAGIGAESFVWPPPGDPGRAPYRGWEPLEEIDAAVFFGRDAQIVKALDAMRGMRLSGVNALFVVLGPSGTGKSSFLRAGVLPRLRREDRRFVLLDIVRPERNVLVGDSGLAQAITRTRARFGLRQPSLGEIKAVCADGDVSAVAGWLAEIRDEAANRLVHRRADDSGASTAPTLVLPLDQAEELFSVDFGDSAGVFLRLLAGVVEQLNSTEIGLAVAATIRTDRYEVLQTHPALADVGALLFDELKPMPPTQFKEVITGPGRRATEAGKPLAIAPDLVDRLLADAAEGADTLPMLALTMSRLYADYGSTGELTLAQYESMGGMRRIVQTEIDDVLSDDPQKRAAELEALRSAFIPWLATINPDNDQPMRRVSRWSDLPEPSRPLIDALVGKRLMVKDTRDGETVVEVALESLLRQWDALAAWLREQRKELKDADDLERSAAAWAANEQDPAWLVSGSRLTEAETLANTTGFRQRLAETASYLAASRDAENRRLAAEEEQRQAELRMAQERQATAEAHTATLRKRSRVLRAVLAVTAVVAVIACVGFVRANHASNEAQRQFREATSERLTAEAEGMLGGTRNGNNAQAFKELLAARLLTDSPDDDVLHNAVVNWAPLKKMVAVNAVVLSIAYSGDGELLATGDAAGHVRVWDANSGEPHGDWTTQLGDQVTDVAFSPDRRLVASASRDDSVRLWNVDSGQQEGEPIGVGTDAVLVAFSPDGQRVIVADTSGSVRQWDATTRSMVGRPLKVDGGGAEPKFAVSADGVVLAAGLGSGVVELWDLVSGAPLGQLTGHTNTVQDVSFSADGRRLVSAGFDKSARVWDVATRTPIGQPIEHSAEVTAASLSPDGRRLATATQSFIVVSDVDTGAQISDRFVGSAGIMFDLAYRPDGRRVVSGSSDLSMRIWDFVEDETFPGQRVRFSPDGRQLFTGSADGTVQRWDAESREPIGPPIAAHAGPIFALFVSSDGKRIATATDSSIDNVIRYWDVATGRPVGQAVAEGSSFSTLEFNPDWSRMVTSDPQGFVQVRDAANATPSGPRLGEEPKRFAELDVRFVGDGTEVAAVDFEGNLRGWDAKSGDELYSEKGSAIAAAAALAPDGQHMTGSLDGTVSFYGPRSAEPINSGGQASMITEIGFRADAKRAVTGARDGSYRLWDVERRKPIGATFSSGSEVQSVDLSSDGKWVVVSGANNVTHLYPAGATPQDLCDKLTTNMSHKQWKEWVSQDIDYIKACPDLPVAPD